MTLRLPHCIIFSLILTVLLTLNLFFWGNFLVGIFFGLTYLLFFGLIFGTLFFSSRSLFFRSIYGLFFLLAGISFLGALIYYFYELNDLIITILVVGIPLILIPLWALNKKPRPGDEHAPIRITSQLLLNSFLVSLFIFLDIINFQILLKLSTAEAIRTPWSILPFKFFVVFFAASTILLLFLFKNKKSSLGLLLSAIHTFFIVSVALIVYKIGYGFDPFIHQATEKAIFNDGFILPKPLYYLGQYSLVIFLAKIFSLPVLIIDKLLLPSFIAIFLAPTIYFSFRQLFNNFLNPIILSVLIFILPFSSFINTTPQGLANFILLILILLSVLSLKKEFPLSMLWFLAFTTFLIHPLAGLPALIFTTLLTIYLSSFLKNKSIKIILFSLTFLLTTFIIPLFFTLASLFLGNGKSIFSIKQPENIILFLKELNWHWPTIINHFNPFLDIIYTYGKNISFIIILTSLTGMFLIRKKLPTFFIYPTAFLSLIINYILLKSFITFPALIQYEQNVYPARILEISFYFLIPLFLFALYKFLEKISQSNFLTKTFFILIFSLFLTFSLYYSYPKDDGEDYQIDRGYSVSRADISAVQKIEENASGHDYIVLANQSVSAAAVREFGFKKYYGPYFYYPVPTGDQLYQYYLKMVYEMPSRKTIKEASNLVGVDLVYFVLNKYWTDAEKISVEAKKNADQTILIDNKITIFKYQF